VRSRLRWAAALGVAVVAAVLVVVFVVESSPAPAGYDLAAPQCSGSYPSNPLFAVVGVNGGLANTANPCLAGELRWAQRVPGQKRPAQPPLSFYIDTANPGAHHVADWPRGGTTPVYGACNGLLTDACSYLYGEQRAEHSYKLVSSLDPVAAQTAPWWLDVELGASWAGTYELNIAALRGFVAGLQHAGVKEIGVYSTSAQWHDITGLTARTTQRAFRTRLAGWIASAHATLADARRNCATGGFTGAAPTLAQYEIGRFDGDLRCGSG
jgi:hypothetical protein